VAVQDVTGPVVALVPVRSPGVGKTRLAAELSPLERAELSGAMLADVTAALTGAAVDRVVVAASGPAAAAAGSALGAEVMLDPPGCRSLDTAVSAAAARLGPGGTLLVVTADLPRLSGADVDALLAVDAAVAVAATDDGGTGGLLRRPPVAIPTAYGRRSAARHLGLARRAGVASERVVIAGFRHDVDTWEDVLALREGHVGPATRAFLGRITTRLEDTG
jgi:2-phospho-L-lactate guanylyltransferase